jgi:SPX domain protein involved in polyphosphate accumulation
MRVYKVLVTIVYDYLDCSIGEILGYEKIDDTDYRLKLDGFYVKNFGQCFVIDLDASIKRPYAFIFERYKEILNSRILEDSRDSKIRSIDESL